MLPSCCMAKNALKLKKKFNKKLYVLHHMCIPLAQVLIKMSQIL